MPMIDPTMTFHSELMHQQSSKMRE